MFKEFNCYKNKWTKAVISTYRSRRKAKLTLRKRAHHPATPLILSVIARTRFMQEIISLHLMSPRVSVSINYYIFICRLVIKVTFFQIMVRLHFVKICWKIGTMPRNNMNPPYSISPLWSIIRKIVAWKGATKIRSLSIILKKRTMILCVYAS